MFHVLRDCHTTLSISKVILPPNVCLQAQDLSLKEWVAANILGLLKDDDNGDLALDLP